MCVGGDGDVDGGWVVKVLCRQSTAATVQAASSGLPWRESGQSVIQTRGVQYIGQWTVIPVVRGVRVQ